MCVCEYECECASVGCVRARASCVYAVRAPAHAPAAVTHTSPIMFRMCVTPFLFSAALSLTPGAPVIQMFSLPTRKSWCARPARRASSSGRGAAVSSPQACKHAAGKGSRGHGRCRAAKQQAPIRDRAPITWVPRRRAAAAHDVGSWEKSAFFFQKSWNRTFVFRKHKQYKLETGSGGAFEGGRILCFAPRW